AGSMLLAVSLAAVLSTRCAHVAEVDSLAEGPCSAEFEQSLFSILGVQGEKPEVTRDLAHRTYVVLTSTNRGPRPFFVSSPFGTDYTFFVDNKRDRCLLRLYGRQHGFMS